MTEEIRVKQKQIGDLIESIQLWIGTPNAQRGDVKAKVGELQDRLLFRLHELEMQGMDEKIATMTKQLAILKGEVDAV